MELTPQLLTDEIDFRIAVRGYDRHEVDDFLERVAVAVGQLQSQLTKAVGRAKTAEARVAELEAGGATTAPAGAGGTKVDAATEKPAEPADSVETPVEKTPEVEPEQPAAPGKSAVPAAVPSTVIGDDEELNEELRRTLVLAQRTADTAIREAREEARSIVAQANDEARRNREAAEAAHAKAREEARSRLVAEIRELEATREAMRSDTVVLERYLGTERARVRETIQVLRRLVDDPGSFQTGDLPALSNVATPAELGAGTPAIEAASGGTATESEVPADAAAAQVDTPDSGTPAAEAPAADAPPSAESAEGNVIAPELPRREPNVETAEDPSADAPAPVEPVEADTPGSGSPAPGDADTASAGSDADSLGQLFSSSDGPKDWRSTGTGRGDQGPHTQPVAAARFEEESDEAFLAELRRAMNDDEPLGPDAH